ASQVSTTCDTAADEPRSTCSHCGSENWLDQRVVALPSTAADAGVPAFSTDEAVAGLPCDSRTVAALAPCAATTRYPASNAPTAATSTATKTGRRDMRPPADAAGERRGERSLRE